MSTPLAMTSAAPAVKSSAALSPTMRPTARMQPVTMPSMLQGQHDGADDVPFARAQTQRTLTVALGHRFQGFLGGADDGGQVHDHQRQAAGEQAGLEAQCLGEHQHPHQTVNDTGDARQRLVGELDHRDDLAVLGVLGQVNGRATPSGSTIKSVSRMTYSVLRIAGRMPSVPFSTLAVVVRNFQLMCGMRAPAPCPECPPPVR